LISSLLGRQPGARGYLPIFTVSPRFGKHRHVCERLA